MHLQHVHLCAYILYWLCNIYLRILQGKEGAWERIKLNSEAVERRWELRKDNKQPCVEELSFYHLSLDKSPYSRLQKSLFFFRCQWRFLKTKRSYIRLPMLFPNSKQQTSWNWAWVTSVGSVRHIAWLCAHSQFTHTQQGGFRYIQQFTQYHTLSSNKDGIWVELCTTTTFTQPTGPDLGLILTSPSPCRHTFQLIEVVLS